MKNTHKRSSIILLWLYLQIEESDYSKSNLCSGPHSMVLTQEFQSYNDALSYNFSFSLPTALYSSAYKHHIVSPIFKKHVLTFHPLHIWSVFLALFLQRIVYVSCLYFFISHSVFNPLLSGFCPPYTHETTMVKVINNDIHIMKC